MELFQTIAARHCYRGLFTDAPVPREDLQKIAEAGLLAPTACNAQTPTLVIVDDPQLLRQMAEIIDKPVCRSAKAMIVCVADPRPVFGKLSFAAEDCAAAVENMLLAITALGYVSVWLDGVLRGEDRAARIGRLLNVPAGKSVRIVLPIGRPAEPIEPPQKLPFSERAWFNRHG